jgi:hypothetical protein
MCLNPTQLEWIAKSNMPSIVHWVTQATKLTVRSNRALELVDETLKDDIIFQWAVKK